MANKFMQNNKEYQQLQISDPDLAHTMSQLITVDAMASVSLLASAGSRSSNLLDMFRGHIMTSDGNWGSIMENIQTLDDKNGPYRSWLRAVGITQPTTPDPPDLGPAAHKAAGGAGGGPGPAPSLRNLPSSFGPAEGKPIWDGNPTSNYPHGHWIIKNKKGQRMFTDPVTGP